MKKNGNAYIPLAKHQRLPLKRRLREIQNMMINKQQ
jgi:hypothetical protein